MKYEEPKQLSDGRFFARASNETGTKIVVQLNNSIIINSDEITLQLSSAGLQKVKTIDTSVLQDAKVNSVSWFGREIQQKTLDTAYNHSVTSDNYMNVTKSTKNPLTYYDSNKTLKDSSLLENGTVCDVLLEMVGVWFLKKTFGVQWRIVQVRDTKMVKVPEYLFQDEEEKQEEDDEDYA
jgi:hypothetical protein